MSCLIREHGVAHVVYFCEDVFYFSTPELVGVVFLKWFWLGGSNVFAALVEVTLWCFGGLGIVFSHVVFCEKGPSDVVTCLDCFEPR